ncbi:undecaprenyl-phosphate glucose phosphotransferase [Kiritimatiellaeota bacterium B1221]|nr:undecaprenyl-phosphate glucose phosphotransferase [Kiritimatiellaeota bacterium B1221]
MQSRQTTEHLLSSLLAIVSDGLAIFGGFGLAVWIRFDSGWMAVEPQKGIPSFEELLRLILLAVLIFLVVFNNLHLYKRPHQGRFEDTIPRIIRAILMSFVLYFALEAALRLDPAFSRKALAISLGSVSFFVLLERYLLYRIELHKARHAPTENQVIMVGTDPNILRLAEAIEADKFLRAKVLGFLRVKQESPWPEEIQEIKRLGSSAEVQSKTLELKANHVVLSDVGIDRDALLELVVFCEHNYISFHLVPDLFRILTSDLQVRHLAGIPIMGLGQWPLDRIGPRLLKRGFDICFSISALIGISPVLLIAAIAVKISSKGPIFYRQIRCGEHGKHFNIIKLRTMRADAEETGPGWTTEDDPRRTKIGEFLRKWNIDELPQFWNVLCGQMSVVGPRPERPHYVEQFKDEINRYMRRHAHKPGITGWAQVHGLRGDTSIDERIRYDLFYLENWSPGLDLKIILKTFSANKNAY